MARKIERFDPLRLGVPAVCPTVARMSERFDPLQLGGSSGLSYRGYKDPAVYLTEAWKIKRFAQLLLRRSSGLPHVVRKIKQFVPLWLGRSSDFVPLACRDDFPSRKILLSKFIVNGETGVIKFEDGKYYTSTYSRRLSPTPPLSLTFFDTFSVDSLRHPVVAFSDTLFLTNFSRHPHVAFL